METTILVFLFIFLIISVVTATGILVPQAIRLTKNKEKDNSSLLMYWIFFGCNLMWTFYQICFITYNVYMTDNIHTYDLMAFVPLWLQLTCDILALIISGYCITLKIYYSKKVKKQPKKA